MKSTHKNSILSAFTSWQIMIPGAVLASAASIAYYVYKYTGPEAEAAREYDSRRRQLIEYIGKAPRVGYYNDEDKSCWDGFYTRLRSMYALDKGVKGDLNRKVTESMREAVLSIEEELKALECSVEDSIDKIHIRLERSQRSLDGGRTFHTFESSKAQFESRKEFVDKMSDTQSKEYLRVLGGLNKKYQDAKVVEEKMDKMVVEYVAAMERSRDRMEECQKQLEDDLQYLMTRQVEKTLKPYLDEWKGFISQLGKDNHAEGKVFEKTCMKAMKEVVRRLGLKKDVPVVAVSNVKWNFSPGEVDIVLINPKNRRVLALVECKSRAFDIAHAYSQSGPNRSYEKKSFWIKLPEQHSIVFEVPKDCPCFVITKLPSEQMDDDVPTESKLKYLIDTIMRFGYDEQKREKVLKSKIQRFCLGKQSPQDFCKKLSKYLIVLD